MQVPLSLYLDQLIGYWRGKVSGYYIQLSVSLYRLLKTKFLWAALSSQIMFYKFCVAYVHGGLGL